MRGYFKVKDVLRDIAGIVGSALSTARGVRPSGDRFGRLESRLQRSPEWTGLMLFVWETCPAIKRWFERTLGLRGLENFT